MQVNRGRNVQAVLAVVGLCALSLISMMIHLCQGSNSNLPSYGGPTGGHGGPTGGQQKNAPYSSDIKRAADVCIVGAGLSGAVIAERYANELKQSVLVMEKRDHIGGNCYDYIDEETGIRVSKYGAHLFHTKYKRVWEYAQRFADWIPYEHEVLAYIHEKHVPVPVNIDTVNTLFGLDIKTQAEMDDWLKKEQVPYPEPKNSEEMALSRVGKRLYEMLFKPYTIKQWAKTPAELGECAEKACPRNLPFLTAST